MSISVCQVDRVLLFTHLLPWHHHCPFMCTHVRGSLVQGVTNRTDILAAGFDERYLAELSASQAILVMVARSFAQFPVTLTGACRLRNVCDSMVVSRQVCDSAGASLEDIDSQLLLALVQAGRLLFQVRAHAVAIKALFAPFHWD